MRRLFILLVICFAGISLTAQESMPTEQRNPRDITLSMEGVDIDRHARSQLKLLNKRITRVSPAASLNKNQETKILAIYRKRMKETYVEGLTKSAFSQHFTAMEEKYRPEVNKVLTVVQRRSLLSSRKTAIK